MNVFLLYEDKEADLSNKYYDYRNIINDLELSGIITAASRNQNFETGRLNSLVDEDKYVGNILEQVMMCPLESCEQIKYRQDIIKDVIAAPELMAEIYELADRTMIEWDRIGRKKETKIVGGSMAHDLLPKAKKLELFVQQLEGLKKIIDSHKNDEIKSAGIRNLIERFEHDFNENIRKNLDKILNDISFYTESDREVSGARRSVRIGLNASVIDGFKLGSMELSNVETISGRRKKARKKINASELLLGAFYSGPSGASKEDYLLDDLNKLEYRIVDYIISNCSSFMDNCGEFFENLHVQTAFYIASLNLYRSIKHHGLPCCYPSVCNRENFETENLIELNMALYRSTVPVGNTLAINDKMMWIITGANQGGKSTFLRSVGIAQIMMQCGLYVCADSYCSGLFKHIYMHFTRREDSQMNSGRLDEELSRMRKMLDDMNDEKNISGDALVLLNESFATTTEKEGSVIAYDIAKALFECNVKVLTVTHLLSFAQKMYAENNKSVEFLSAERTPEQTRTFKMVKNVPQLTSFGLDLYEQILM